MDTERWFERLAAEDEERAPERAPARLKARVFSTLVDRLADDGRLLSLRATKASGAGLCVFEQAVAALPTGETIGSMNPCRICHARILAERLDRAPIFWPNCPYSAFHQKARG